MTLKEWVADRGGPVVVASKLGVTRQAVLYWLAGKATPRPPMIFKIVQLSGGKLTYRQILEETWDVRARA